MKEIGIKGVGEGGSGGLWPRTFKSWGAQVGLSLPLLDRSSVLISPFASFFLVKNEKFSWLASLANLTLFIFSKLG